MAAVLAQTDGANPELTVLGAVGSATEPGGAAAVPGAKGSVQKGQDPLAFFWSRGTKPWKKISIRKATLRGCRITRVCHR